MIWNALKRWPLLVIGVLLIGWAITFVTDSDQKESRALLFGIGAVVLGAGLAVVILGYAKTEDKDDREEV